MRVMASIVVHCVLRSWAVGSRSFHFSALSFWISMSCLSKGLSTGAAGSAARTRLIERTGKLRIARTKYMDQYIMGLRILKAVTRVRNTRALLQCIVRPRAV